MMRGSFVVATTASVLLGSVAVLVAAQPAKAAEPYQPKATLAADLEGLAVPLVDDYAASRPRLLFGPGDRDVLRRKAAAQPERWNEVLASAKRWPEVPEPKEIRSGGHYWRIERVQSAALAWFVTGEEAYKKTAVEWMVAHCREDVWGDGDWRPNIDLFAAWHLYHIGIAYDILHDALAPADRDAIRDGLAAHARAIYESLDPAEGHKFTYDQNHAYIPTIGMTTAALALLGEVPE
ncbi:MAG: hypothetical protein JXL80_14020, partial [Planctomycetes bacterium]|nr:hypothetical protein [Planctomycetota bacterium]